MNGGEQWRFKYTNVIHAMETFHAISQNNRLNGKKTKNTEKEQSFWTGSGGNVGTNAYIQEQRAWEKWQDSVLALKEQLDEFYEKRKEDKDIERVLMQCEQAYQLVVSSQ